MRKLPLRRKFKTRPNPFTAITRSRFLCTKRTKKTACAPGSTKLLTTGVHHALAAMHDQHMAIDDLLERLLPLLRLVGNNPGALADAGGEMCSITKRCQRCSPRICRWKRK